MKLFYAILTILAFSQFSCSKKNDPPPIPAPEPEEYVKWKLQGKAYEITSFTKPLSTSTPPPAIYGESDNYSTTSTVEAIDYNPNGGDFYLTFHKTASGQYVMYAGDININGFGNSLTGVENTMAINIIELGATGEFIKGTLTGKLTTILSGGPQYDFSGEFKVKNGN